jgi:uncharacterized protein involved in response to NO
VLHRGHFINMSMPAALQRRLSYSGPALFSYGFRPFFLGGAIWAAASIVLWIPQYTGALTLGAGFAPLDWHIHEMLFGYVAAVIAGFLLTAIPNWTGRLPVCGLPLAALSLLWLAGRIAMLFAAQIGAVTVAVIDVSFLATLAAVAAREIVAGRNWRNLRVLAVVGVLIAANAIFHVETSLSGTANYGVRLGIAAVIVLISLIGGRIVPSFTRNWLARQAGGRMPAPFSRFDGATIVVSAAALAIWVARPDAPSAGLALLAAAALQIVRLGRWAGERTLADRLVLVLHVAYAFIPAGFALLGAAILDPALLASAGIHAWTAGAIGLMTLAVMTRASLGHTGQPLTASPGTHAIYALALVAALLRVAGAFAGSILLVEMSALAWVAAFAGFALIYGPLLLRCQPVWANRC